jgi:MOSC domain-containing protein YiiM
MTGVLHSINVSNGGVPKRPRDSALITAKGVQGDRQRDLEHHGGPFAAVCIYSLELIHALQAEGHPIAPGTIGENLTLAGVPWERMVPGARVQVGEVALELTSYTTPCTNIAGSFKGRVFKRVAHKLHPGWSRLYARVLREGTVRQGDSVQLVTGA